MTDRVEFRPPKEFVPPEIGQDATFDLVCTFKAKPGGMICLTQLGETKMPGYDKDEPAQKAKPSYGDMANQMGGSNEMAQENPS